MAFNIYHVQIRPLTSNDSAIDTVTIPALPQYQVYIANISQQGGNPSSQDPEWLQSEAAGEDLPSI